jgi:transposase
MPTFSRLPRPPTLEGAWAELAEQAQTIARLEAENAAVRAENATLRVRVAQLEGEGERLRALVEPLQAAVTTLQGQVQELTVRLGQNSTNSSKPPSSDPPSAPPRPPQRSTGRQRGGQPGHPGQSRPWTSPDRVDRVVEVRPEVCAACGGLLLGAAAEPDRHQVTDLPVVQPVVTEYRRHALTCPACGTTTTPPWPAEMAPGAFGPRVTATVGYLTGRLGMSQRDTAEALETLFGTVVSLGSIPALAQTVSAALAEPVAAAQRYVRERARVNVDETSWPEGTLRHWLWVAATTLVTVFLVQGTRGAAGAQALLGTAYAGIVGSDRWSAYTWLALAQRQVCWAHLLRDFESFLAWGGESAVLGRALLTQADHLFEHWPRVRDGTLSRAEFQAVAAPIQAEVGRLLRDGTTRGHPKTQGTCKKMLTVEAALWTFVWEEGVEPTNNAAERPLRRAVLWRRRSHGTQSEAGSRCAERLLTAVTTLRQQHRDVLAYLTTACAATTAGVPAASLLPDVAPTSA